MVQPQEHIDATLSAADTYEVEPEKLRHLSSRGWRYAFKRVVQDFLAEGLLDLAALLTYFTVLSLAPALLVVYSIITLVLASDTLEILSRVEEFVHQFVPAEQRELVLSLVDSVAGSAAGGQVGLIIGVLVALWTSSAYVRAFSRCANAIYNRAEGRGLLRQTGAMLLTNIGLLIGSVLILISLVVNETLVDRLLEPIAAPLRLGGVLEFLTDTFLPIWVWAKWPFILVLLIGLVSSLYYFTPNVKPLKFRLLSAGSLTAIIGIILAGGALNIYFSVFASFNSYGAVGSVMALLIGMWIINTVLLLGVKIDAEVGRARQLQAGIHAEVHNQVPPRSIERVAGMKESQEKLIAKGREFRISSNGNAAGEETEAEES
ncbi:YihY/virulence factor BrkB family protein [Corynebacterium sp. A21]|uniref:YihY/virulence factor BrkB family protein n=1 Tax=Corynebacterium sp. A21 TaxID=3457318 RepID=UPI003FD66585